MPDGDTFAELAQLVDAASRLKAEGRYDEAGAVCSRIIQVTAVPVNDQERQARGEAFNYLAAMASQRDQYGTAMDFFHQAISLSPIRDDVVKYRLNLVRVLLQVQWRDRARQEIEKCKRIAGEQMMPAVLRHAGLVSREEGNGEQSVAEYREAVELSTDEEDYWPVRLELAAALADTAQLDEAEAIYRQASETSPKFKAEGEHGIGLCLMRKMECRQAIDHFNRALAIDPSISMAHWNRALSYLTIGNYADGWRDHEYRFALGIQMAGVAVPARRFQRPLWDGKPPRNGRLKRLHIHSEMGLGDTLQFCRYALMARDMGHDVRVETADELVSLLSHSLPGVKVRKQAEDWPGAYGLDEFDCHAPMMSLPFMVGTKLDTIPYGDQAYLKAEPDKVAEWAERLSNLPNPRVGICWHGRAREQLWVRELDRRRSIEFPLIEQHFKNLPISFVSLDLNQAPVKNWSGFHEYGRHIKDFSDTAALIENLDLVVSVDTSCLHLAAGLGKPTWLLNRTDSCWRWMDDGETSPWYPTLKIYRQPSFKDWHSVLMRVRFDLKELAC